MQAELYSQIRHYQPLCAGVKSEVKRHAIIIVQKLQLSCSPKLGGVMRNTHSVIIQTVDTTEHCPIEVTISPAHLNMFTHCRRAIPCTVVALGNTKLCQK